MPRVSIAVTGVSELAAAMGATVTRVEAAGQKAAATVGALVEASVKAQFGNGTAPAVRTGTLRRSVVMDPVVPIASGVWTTTVAPHVVYARIQELGGTIQPRQASALAFTIDGQSFFVQQVTLPARPYMGPGVAAALPLIPAVMTEAWEAALTV